MSNHKEGRKKWLNLDTVTVVLALALSLFHIYTTIFGLFDFITQRGIHLSLGLAVLILCRPTSKLVQKKFHTDKNLTWLYVLDIAMILALWWACYASKTEYTYSISHAGQVNSISTIAGVILVVVILIISWRCLGPMLPCLAILFILYARYGKYMPSFFQHRGYSFEKIFQYMSSNQNGIFGMCLSVSASTIYLFILFGAFLEVSGASELINQVAVNLTGRLRSGPALAAVVSSAFMGTINGSAVANVVATGTFTIPLMKTRGYSSDFAGGVESVASTGGQILPPVMGAGAFLMVAFTGISYNHIALAAVIPAMLYFLAAGLAVIFEAGKADLKAADQSKMVWDKEMVKRGIACLASILTLVYELLFKNLTSTTAAGMAILVLTILMIVFFPREYGIKKIGESLISAAKSAGPIIIGCACSGIVVAMVNLTGIGVSFGDLMISLAGTNLMLGLIFAAAACIILGMGLPTSAAYVIAASILASPLTRLGVNLLQAHLFLFYYACLSCITPPVALASYAAAGIAKSNPFKTAAVSCKIGFVGFIIPFLFVYNPALTAAGEVSEILICTVTAVIGVVALSGAFIGYFLKVLGAFERVLLFASGILMFLPERFSDIGGVALFAVALAILLAQRKKNGTAK